MKFAAEDARILDAGSGMGLVGALLAEGGYQNLIAMDLSNGMLDEARKKNVYKEFRQMVMGETLAFDTDAFDPVLSVGDPTRILPKGEPDVYHQVWVLEVTS